MHRFPVVVEEFLRVLWFLVEEDEGAEVGLLVGPRAEFDFVEVVLVDEVVLARWCVFHVCRGCWVWM